MNCLLCNAGEVDVHFEHEDPRYGTRTYWCCGQCGLIFLEPSQRLKPEDEKARYDTHQNDPNDEGYVGFLKRLAIPLSERLQPGQQGLDFGCGPGPTMSVILGEKGFEVEDYDPFYFPDHSLLDKAYDFISCSEVVEHLFEPRKEFQRLDNMLLSNSYLGIMTEFSTDPDQFSDWWYHRDPTHVCFYSVKTFDWIASWKNWLRSYPQKNVVIFQKSA
jgi:hypothetical protein